MKRLGVALVPALIAAASLLQAQAGGGWVTLFDGKNFNNFTMTGNANWKIADGVAEADVARGFLVSRQSYTDFELTGEVYGKPESNAGFLFRITDARDPGITNGYELNINDQRKDQDGRTGSIVNISKPLVKFDAGNKWVKVEIMARGPKMTAKLDGVLVADASDGKFKSGPIALQAAGGLVRYRNVQIRELR